MRHDAVHGARGLLLNARCLLSPQIIELTIEIKTKKEIQLLICMTQERQRLLSFVIVGGGPTGVEVAAEMYDMIQDDLR